MCVIYKDGYEKKYILSSLSNKCEIHLLSLVNDQRRCKGTNSIF